MGMEDHKLHEFTTRGCGEKPRIHQRNDHIYCHGACKRNSYDWLDHIHHPNNLQVFDFVEVRFKNSRKEFFRVPPRMDLVVGDIVAVESSPGHDIGIVTLLGEAARLQMKRKRADVNNPEAKKVYRRIRPSDIEKWLSSVGNEETVLMKTKKVSRDLKLDMKMNDVEYQADGTKAIFYYTAEERVDFREMIKILAEQFGIRVEMRQIGMRQEASNLGGIGTCGRELCCSTWLHEFRSVNTGSARVQQLSINPQKLAGQCGKLKCCLNFEYDCYQDALRNFPETHIHLKTKKGEAHYLKTDVFKQVMWYSYLNDTSNMMAIPVNKVKEIIEKNRKNILPEKLEDFAQIKEKKIDFANEEDDLTRFDNVR
jgi:cell fate regulator YaaT (PSP1 superfamily)